MSEIIRRYMSFDKFASLLLSKSIFLPKMTQFSDDLEGGLPASHFISMSNDAAIFDLAVNGDWPREGGSPAERERRLESNEETRKQIDNRKFPTPFGMYESNDIATIHPKCREWIYVSCWNRSDVESMAMWKIYGESKNSVCLVSDKDSILNSVWIADGVSVEFYDVDYIDHDSYSEAFCDGNGFTPFRLKSREYQFENETRLVCLDPSVDLAVSEENPENGMMIKIKDLSGLINKVVVSPDSDPWFKSVVEQFMGSLGISGVVFDSDLKKERSYEFWDNMIRLYDNK